MTELLQLFSSRLSPKVTLTLIHTLWQAAALAGLLYAVLRALPARNANTRYAVSIGALTAVLLSPLVTWNVLGRTSPGAGPSAADSGRASAAAVQVDGVGEPVLSASSAPEEAVRARAAAEAPREPAAAGEIGRVRRAFSAWLSRWSPLFAAGWLAGVSLMLLRSGLSLRGAARLRRAARACEDAGALGALDELRRALGITRRIRLAVCEGVKSPAVLGIIWPLVLVPGAVITGVPTDHLRAILAHELAHVRRYDYLVNLAQTIVEALLFFNPAVWWISRQVRIEREACCDAAAVAATGEAAMVAEVLADWAERIAAPLRGPAVAFAGHPGGTLLERLRRLGSPAGRPSMRLSWYGFAGVLVSSALVIALLGRGAGLAVHAARKLFSHEQRIERLAEIEKTHGDVAEEPWGTEANVRVSGVVRTFDGKALPGRTQLRSRSARRGNASHHGLTLGEDGRFLLPVMYGEIHLAAEAPGYAPAFAGPFRVEPDGTVENIELVLTAGFRAEIMVVDAQGEPVPAAVIKGQYMHPSSLTIESFMSDEKGIAAIEHCGGSRASFEIRADGFQHDRMEVDLAPGKGVTWALAPAAPTTGLVVSKETGAPIAGSELRLISRSGSPRFSTQTDPQFWLPPLAATDSDGRFSLLSLRDDCAYAFHVWADGYAPAFLDGVRPAQENLRVELGPELYVRGSIIAPEELPGARGKSIHYAQPRRTGDTIQTSWDSLPLEVRDGIGYFEIRDLWAGPLRITAGRETLAMDITAPVEDLVIDLTPPEEAETPPALMRPVELRFVVPEGAPATQGAATISFSAQPGDSTTFKMHMRDERMPIENGAIRLEVPAPGNLSWDCEGISGYWVTNHRQYRHIPAGEDPLVIDIECIPAGAIYGRVLQADGSPANLDGPNNALVSIVTVEKAPDAGQGGLDVKVGSQPGGKSMAGPLPLGGRYAVVAHRRSAYVVSDAVTIDDTAPVREMDLQLAEGLPVEVHVFEPDGKPAVGVRLSVGYSTPYNHGFGGGGLETDRHGRIVFEHVNPDVPGGYYLSIKSRAKYRPVRLPLDPTGGPVTIRLESGEVLTGRVIDDDTGQPVEGLEVYAIRHGDGVSEILEMEGAKTGKDGAFRFSNMAAREYQLGVRGGQTAGEYAAVGGQADPVEIRVKVRR